MSRAGQMQILALNKMVNIKIFEEKLNKPTGKHPRFSQFNAPRIEPGYKWCFSSLSSSSHPFWGRTLFLSWVNSLSWFCCTPTSSCTSVTWGMFRRRGKGLAAMWEAGKAPFMLEYGSIQVQRVPAATRPRHCASSLGSLTLPATRSAASWWCAAGPKWPHFRSER